MALCARADTGNSRVRNATVAAAFVPTLHIMASAFFLGFRPEAVGRSDFVAMGVSAADLPVAVWPPTVDQLGAPTRSACPGSFAAVL